MRLISMFVMACGVMLGQSWLQLNPSGTPPTIHNTSSVAYDQPGNNLIVFNQDLIWVLSHANGLLGTPAWTQLSPSGTPPSSSDEVGIVYDPGSNRLITFGGNSPVTNDVWVLTNANGTGGTPQWTQLFPAGPLPSPRFVNSIVYDSGDNRLIIFGGSAPSNDVWVLSNANGIGGTPAWTQLLPTGGPPPARCCLAAGYDPGSNRMMIFGGNLGPTGINDSWVLTNANGLAGTPQWVELSPANPPLDRYNMAFGYNPNTNELVITQGVSNYPSQGGFIDPSTWKLDGANGTGTAVWTQLSPTGTPPSPRQSLEYDSAMDSVNDRLIMFGGDELNDVWVLVLPPPPDAIQIGYAANLKAGDSFVNLTNAGSNGGSDPAGDICANVYVFAEDQQLIACCSCLLTPNHLKTLSAQNDLINNTLTPGVPIGITTMLVASAARAGTSCDATGPGQLVSGLRAWGTTLHEVPGGKFATTENRFLNVTYNASEFAKLTTNCAFIEADGSTHGICGSCVEGTAGASKR